jgi:c-di-GMP-binding flagellar brake protein YcgR
MEVKIMNNIINIGIDTSDIIHIVNINKTLFQGVIKVINSNYIAVTINIEQENYSKFAVNQSFQFLFSTNNKAYRCNAIVMGCKLCNDKEILLIHRAEIISNIERRKYQRVNTVQEVYFSSIPNEVTYRKIKDLPSKFYRNMKKTFTSDISGNGISIIFSNMKELTKKFLLKLNLEGENIYILCSFNRKDPIDSSENFKIALEFLDIASEDQDTIVKFVDKKLTRYQETISIEPIIS